MADDHRSEKPEELSPEQARQGRWGWQVLMVLVVGLLLAMGVWWGVEIYGENIAPAPEAEIGNPSNTPAPAPSEQAPVNPATPPAN